MFFFYNVIFLVEKVEKKTNGQSRVKAVIINLGTIMIDWRRTRVSVNKEGENL